MGKLKQSSTNRQIDMRRSQLESGKETGQKQDQVKKQEESPDEVLKRIHKRFSFLIKKYQLDIWIDHIVYKDAKDLQIIESLMEKIQSKIILGESSGTLQLVDGQRFEAKIGNNRMVIIDAGENKYAGHQFAIALHGDGLNFHAINKNQSNDAAFNVYKKALFASESAKEKASRQFRSYFWYNNATLLDILRETAGKDNASYKPLTKTGSQGDHVGLIQSALETLDRKTDISKKETDGNDFGSSTRASVILFQNKHGLPPSGIVDAATLASMDEALYKIEQNAKNVRDFSNNLQKDQKDRVTNTLADLKLNKKGNIIYKLPALNAGMLRQEGIEPSKLQFVYKERDEFIEMLGDGGARYEVYYDGSYMGVVDVQLDLNLKDKEGKIHSGSLNGGRRNKGFFANAYSGKHPELYDKIQGGEVFRIAYGLGSKGGDPDFMETLGLYGFVNHRGTVSTFEDDAMMGFLDIHTHIEPLSGRSGGTKRGQKYGEMHETSVEGKTNAGKGQGETQGTVEKEKPKTSQEVEKEKTVQEKGPVQNEKETLDEKTNNKSKRLPRSNGHWDGVPGESNWYSDLPEVNAITNGEPIPFKNGYPDYSKWAKGAFTFSDLDGTYKDFDRVYERIAQVKKLPSKTAAKNYLKEKGLTPHHHQDGKTIQLVPTVLNNIPHAGGASVLRKK